MIEDMSSATCISISVVSAVNVLLWVWSPLGMPGFRRHGRVYPDEEAEIELMLWNTIETAGLLSITSFAVSLSSA